MFKTVYDAQRIPEGRTLPNSKIFQIFGLGAKRQKGKILIFRFCRCQGFRDEVPNKSPYIKIRRILYIRVGLLDSQAS